MAVGRSSFDKIYRRLLLSRFFVKGWGPLETLRTALEFRELITNREKCWTLMPSEEEVLIEITKEVDDGKLKVLEGKFITPLARKYPKDIPPPVNTARFQVVLPNGSSTSTTAGLRGHRPLCLLLAGTGDHFYWRRRQMQAAPLAKHHGVASIILEAPYYGLRKPKQQLRSSLFYVTDLLVMGACQILEGLTLLRWAERQGFGPLSVSGVSMGGIMAVLVASNWPKPIAIVPCIAPISASYVFAGEGVMSSALPWPRLCRQLSSGKLPPAVGNLPATTASEKTLVTVKETKEVMHRFLDSMTHVAAYSRPVAPELTLAVAAELDAYVPADGGVRVLPKIWPNSRMQLRLLADCGHVQAYLFHQGAFRQAIVDALVRAAEHSVDDGSNRKTTLANN